MARAISKSGVESIIYVLVVDHMVNFENMPTVHVGDDDIEYTDVLTTHGRKSENSAQIMAEKKFGKNSMVMHVVYKESAKLSLSADMFLANSEICEDGKSYGHETVTAEFKITYISAMWRDKSGLHEEVLIFNGTTTDSKLLNYAREVTHSKLCVVKNKAIITERRWMSRAKYENLARAMKSTGEVENDAE